MSERWYVIEGPEGRMSAITETPDGTSGALAYVGREGRIKARDAALISAAPDLLGAAKKAIEAFQAGEGRGFQSGDEAYAALILAVEKAESSCSRS